MNRNTQVEIIKRLEENYKTNKSFISLSGLKPEEADFLLNSPNIFFPASKSRIIVIHWLMREVRRVYEKVGFVPVDMANEVYESLRRHFNTKAFNKIRFLQMMNLEPASTIMAYDDFSKIEDKYIGLYNEVVPNEMKLPGIKYIYVPKSSECSDLKKELMEILSKKRIEEVLYARATNKTLDSIGQEYGITRERARQIEIKPKALIERWMDERKDELIRIFGGSILANPKKALEYFTEKQWAILKYCAATKNKQKFSNWYYIKDLDTICYSSDFEKDTVQILTDCATNGMSEEETLHKITEKYDFLKKEQLVKFYKAAGIYEYDGKLYASKANIGRGILAALNDEFKDGIKINDKEQLKRFSDYLNSKFGLHTKPNRALTARIQDTLVMSDKATYVLPLNLHSEELDAEIKKQIEQMEDDRTTYQMFFTMIPKDLMESCSITTYSGLHGYIKKNEKRLGVVALRYYICKGDTVSLKSKDFFEKFVHWLKEQNRPCSIEEVKAAFEGWTDMYPKYAMLYFPQVVQWGNGSYFNLECIEMTQEAVDKARKVMEAATKNRLKYTNAYVIYPKLRTNAPEFVADERIKSESHAYLLLKYKLNDGEFVFAKPHILRSSFMNGRTEFTTEDLIRSLIGKKNIFSKPEISEEAQRLYGSKNSSLCLATQHVLDDFCRVSTKNYYRKSCISMSDEDIKKVEEFVEKHMLKSGVMVPLKIDDYEGLPKMPFEWNSWVLCSCIEMFSTKYRVAFKKNNIIQNTMVIVPMTSKYAKREQVAAGILKEDYDGPMNESSVHAYLKKIGIYNQTTPFDLLRKEGIEIEGKTSKAS